MEASARAPEPRPAELRAARLAFAYFFALLASYYLLRPIREEMGIRGGVDVLHWSFTATFVALLVAVPASSALFARVPRVRAVPLVYRFFLLHLVLFAAAFAAGTWPVAVARTFFVWLSVFNLLVVTVFWSLMADLFTAEQGRRLFGRIAAGGSLGAIAGSAAAGLLVGALGLAGVVALAAALLEVAARCAAALTRAGTFLYFQQARIVAEAIPEPARRAALFAGVDLAVNVGSFAVQALATGPLAVTFGLAPALAAVPVLTGAGFLALAGAPSLWVLGSVQALRRVGHYALERPARDVLFTVVPREQKYKSKGFIDTVVYRGGDALAAWTQSGLAALGAGGRHLALAGVPLAALSLVIALWLGRRERRLEGRA